MFNQNISDPAKIFVVDSPVKNIYIRATRQVTIITFTFGLVACHGT